MFGEQKMEMMNNLCYNEVVRLTDSQQAAVPDPFSVREGSVFMRGLCKCGCGQQTNIATKNRKDRNWIKGQPKHFVQNHWPRTKRKSQIPYKINKLTGCWEWKRALNTRGYGVLEVNGQRWLAHRYYYSKYKGDIPDRLVIDHLCRNKLCVNPDHVEPVTQHENILRGDGTKFNK